MRNPPKSSGGPPCASSRHPERGAILAGKYRVERVLGAGGMGVVAAAYHLQLEQRVAIKYLIPEALEHPDLIERFMREARSAAKIRSEHVARVIDVGTFDDEVPFIVLEYLEGETLADCLERGPLPIADAARYVLEICEAIAEAHAANIVHRDIKPGNLFIAEQVDRRRIAKVLDFGISKLLDDEPLTQPSAFLGTAHYMSPEQLFSSKEVDHRTDIWSLGVVLYELLTGEAPFDGINVVDVATLVSANAPIPVLTLRPGVPPELAAVVAKCMQSRVADRYATVLDLATDLAPYADPGDRQSIHTISSVLHGGAEPPMETVPDARSSEIPVTTAASEDREDVLAALRPQLPKERRYGAASMAIAAMVALLVGVAWDRTLSSAPVSGESGELASAPLVSTHITLRLHVSPPGARVRIDDGPLEDAPFERALLRDDRAHRIQVEVAGHESRTETVVFTNDLTLAFALAPLPRADGGADP